jgi:hypothetical protein
MRTQEQVNDLFKDTFRTLYFSNPVFHKGINVTCRNGYKWSDSQGELVNIKDPETEEYYGKAHILGVLTCKLDKIPEGVLALEHDPSCRTTEGIITEMRRVYGEDLKQDAPTTVLFFEFESEQ